MVKTNKPCIFTVSFKLCILFQKLVQKVVKRTSKMKVYYIIPWNYWFTGHPDYFKIKLYYFQEMFDYVSSEITNFRKELFFIDHS